MKNDSERQRQKQKIGDIDIAVCDSDSGSSVSESKRRVGNAWVARNCAGVTANSRVYKTRIALRSWRGAKARN